MKKYDVAIISGYFNPLHVGHLDMIAGAALIAEKVVVIVNNDAQQLRKKGKIICSEVDRVRVLTALRQVDDVFLAVDTDVSVSKSIGVIRQRYPDAGIVFANGGDRRSTMDIAEGEACRSMGIDLLFGAGGVQKVDSSSRINRDIGAEPWVA